MYGVLQQTLHHKYPYMNTTATLALHTMYITQNLHPIMYHCMYHPSYNGLGKGLVV